MAWTQLWWVSHFIVFIYIQKERKALNEGRWLAQKTIIWLTIQRFDLVSSWDWMSAALLAVYLHVNNDLGILTSQFVILSIFSLSNSSFNFAFLESFPPSVKTATLILIYHMEGLNLHEISRRNTKTLLSLTLLCYT